MSMSSSFRASVIPSSFVLRHFCSQPSALCPPCSLLLALSSLPSDADCMKPLLFAALISAVALPLALSQTPSSADNKTAEQEVRQMIETISHRPDEGGYRRARTDLGGRLHLHQRQRRGPY